MNREFRLTRIAAVFLTMGSSVAVIADDTDASATATAPAVWPDTRVYLSTLGSLVTPNASRGSRFGYGAQLALGKRLSPYFEVEVLGTYTDFKTKFSDYKTPEPPGSQLIGGGLGVNYFIAPNANGFANGMFFHLDAEAAKGFHAPGEHRVYKAVIGEAGVGYDYVLNKHPWGFLPEGIAIRTELLYRLTGDSIHGVGTPSDPNRKYFNEGVLNIGFRIPFGAGPPEAVAPAEPAAEVVAPTEAPAAEAPPPPPPPPTCEPPVAGQPITLDGCKYGDTIILRGVNFNFNKATLTLNAKGLLDGVATALQSRPDIKVEIDGHTDGKGSAGYNQRLSEHRAAAVKKYLVGKGVDAGRMTTKGFGKSMPIADNKTDAGRDLNRRVELRVTDSAPGSAAFTINQPGETPSTSDTAPPVAPAADAAPASAPADAAPPPASGDTAAPAADAPPADTATPPADGTAAPAPQ